MVVPVPWKLLLALKLLIRMEPLFSRPMVLGTANTPYGLMSPLLGTVDETALTVDNLAFNLS
jgi:hypothetical protein